MAIEEELLHISTPSRLDYFKSGCQVRRRRHAACRPPHPTHTPYARTHARTHTRALAHHTTRAQYDRRVVEKRKQLEGELALGEEEDGALAKKPKL